MKLVKFGFFGFKSLLELKLLNFLFINLFWSKGFLGVWFMLIILIFFLFVIIMIGVGVVWVKLGWGIILIM